MSSTATPLVMFCTRRILPDAMHQYMEEWTTYSNALFASVPGAKAVVSFEDKDNKGSVLQYFTFDSEASFLGQPPELFGFWSSCTAFDTDSGEAVCQVYGGWSEKLKQAVAVFEGHVRFVLQPPLAGYIKPDGAGLDGPPIIFISKRKVLPGQMEDYGSRMQAVCDHWYEHAPGLLAGFTYTSDDDENAVWDLRVMANWKDGYEGHKYPPGGNPELGKHWFETADGSVKFSGMPSAVAFSNYAEELVQAGPGNAQYTHYAWEERIPGPLPNLNKGSE